MKFMLRVAAVNAVSASRSHQDCTTELSKLWICNVAKEIEVQEWDTWIYFFKVKL